MSVANKLLQAAAGNAGEVVYVDDVFSTFLYEGTDANQTITNGIDLSGEGGLVWTKRRSGSAAHYLHDTERGITKNLLTTSTNAEATLSNGIVSVSSSGYVVGSANKYNGSSHDYVSWTFRKQPGFFDIVTYTGDGTTNRNIAHSLGCDVGMIFVKRTDSSQDWDIYHRALDATYPENYRLTMPDQIGRIGSNGGWGNTYGNPATSTHFNVGANNNTSGASYVAYVFAHNAQDFGEDSDEAIIKCGSYVGNGTGSSSTQHIDLGFEPQFFFTRVAHNNLGSAVNGQSAFIVDTMRGFPNNGDDSNDLRIMPDQTDAEFGYQVGHPTATGIQLNGNEPEVNTNNNTYVYMAIARPHKPASEFAATDLFAIDTQGGTSPTPPAYVSGFPVDMELHKNVTGNGNWRNGARLMQGKYLEPNSTAVEGTDANMTAFDYQNGFRNSTSTGSSKYAWMWRRAKGYFDVVAYTATGSIQTVNHNLGVTPEIMIVKDRDSTYGWGFWHKDLPDPDDEAIMLNTDAAKFSSTIFNKTLPTSTTFQVNYTSGAYIAYLFASVDGIAKVGSYTGTGSDVTVDCGFSAGARFVLIKRIDSTGDWYLYDSDRGIVAGNDPYVFINSNATNVTNTDYIDPDNSGFIVTSSAPAALNNSGGSYIFYAIA